jgi:hypothetical protein
VNRISASPQKKILCPLHSQSWQICAFNLSMFFDTAYGRPFVPINPCGQESESVYSHTRVPRKSNISLFQSLDEFSSSVEPLSLSAYECLPTGSAESATRSNFCPRAVSDIWSQDSRSTAASSCRGLDDEISAPRECSYGYSDYSHLFIDGANFPANENKQFRCVHPCWNDGRPSVVLQLSHLI